MAILAVGVAMTACGGSSSSHHSRTPVTLAAYQSCLEEHGVRPLGTGGRFSTLASRINDPAYTAALKDCDAPLKPSLSRKTIKILHAYIACIAKHGYKLPTPNISGNGPLFPAGTERIHAYRTAAASCTSIASAGLRSAYGVA
jgi:hypothetical protein